MHKQIFTLDLPLKRIGAEKLCLSSIILPEVVLSSQFLLNTKTKFNKTYFFKTQIRSGSTSIPLSAKSNNVNPLQSSNGSGNFLNPFLAKCNTRKFRKLLNAVKAMSCNWFCPADNSSTVSTPFKTTSGIDRRPELAMSIRLGVDVSTVD